MENTFLVSDYNTRLVEAAIAVQDKKTSSSLNNIHIKPLALRESDNDVEYNTIHANFVEIFGEINILDRMMTLNPIRAYRKLSKKKMTFSIDY